MDIVIGVFPAFVNYRYVVLSALLLYIHTVPVPTYMTCHPQCRVPASRVPTCTYLDATLDTHRHRHRHPVCTPSKMQFTLADYLLSSLDASQLLASCYFWIVNYAGTSRAQRSLFPIRGKTHFLLRPGETGAPVKGRPARPDTGRQRQKWPEREGAAAICGLRWCSCECE